MCAHCYWKPNEPHPMDALRDDAPLSAAPAGVSTAAVEGAPVRLCQWGDGDCKRVVAQGSRLCVMHRDMADRASGGGIPETAPAKPLTKPAKEPLPKMADKVECKCGRRLRTRGDGTTPKPGDLCGKCKLKAGAYQRATRVERTADGVNPAPPPRLAKAAPPLRKAGETDTPLRKANGAAFVIKEITPAELEELRATQKGVDPRMAELLRLVDSYEPSAILRIDVPAVDRKQRRGRAFRDRVARALRKHADGRAVPYTVPQVTLHAQVGSLTVVKQPKPRAAAAGGRR